MAKKKGKSDKKYDAGEANASNPVEAELVQVTPGTEVALSKKNTELSSARKNTEVSTSKLCNDLVSVSCMDCLLYTSPSPRD